MKEADLIEAIRRGPVVVETDTVFGIACLPSDAAVAAVFAAKRRPVERNLPVIIGGADQLDSLGVEVTAAAAELIHAFWPGGLTLAFGFDPHRARPDWLGGRDEVAVRVPRVEPLQTLARAAGPFLMTSANVHGEPPATTEAEASEAFADRFPVFAFGLTEKLPAASTLVNVRVDPPRVEREGAVPFDGIRRVCRTALRAGEEQ